MWLWRADHVEGGGLVNNSANPCDNAMVVNGDDVTMCESEHRSLPVAQNPARGNSPVGELVGVG